MDINWFKVVKKIVPIAMSVFLPKMSPQVSTLIVEAIEIAEKVGGSGKEKLEIASNIVTEREPTIDKKSSEDIINAAVDATNQIVKK